MRDMSQRRIVPSYFEGIEQILASQYLLGDSSHSGDKGETREAALVGVLNNHLPDVARAYRGGQIIDVRDTRSSQTDIVIYSAYAPRLGQSSKPLFLAEGVYAAIEQKSVLKSDMLLPYVLAARRLKTLRKIYDDGHDIHESSSPTIRTGLFAYETRMANHKAVIDRLRAIAKQHRIPNYEMPDFITVNQQFTAWRIPLERVTASYSTKKPTQTIEAARARLSYFVSDTPFARMLTELCAHIQFANKPYVLLDAYMSILLPDGTGD